MTMEELPDSTRALILSGTACRVAGVYDRVDKTECVYTFHSPFTRSNSGGIVVNLQTFAGTIPCLAFPIQQEQQQEQEEEGLFVRIVQERKAVNKNNDDDDDDDDDNDDDDGRDDERMERFPASTTPTTLGIGVPGGFASEDDKYSVISTYSFVHLRSRKAEMTSNAEVEVVCEVPYTEETKERDSVFPLVLIQSIDSVIGHAGSMLQQDVQAASWKLMDEDIPISKYAAELPFFDNGVVISPDPSTWKCEASGDTENVWLNLSDGYMGGGRRHWDGSGGSNGAMDHYHDTGNQYPLVVKLGTITKDIGTADCYSYAPDEDGPVRIPNLPQLLERRGISIATLQKTAKSTAELEVELNANYDFDAITEHNALHLKVVAGPKLQGLANLGNSCYLNSVVQVLFHIPEFAQRYGHHSLNGTIQDNTIITHHPLLSSVTPQQAPHHLICQTIKLAMALTTGAYARPADDAAASSDANKDNNDPRYKITPRMFKHCIGTNHVDFSTGQQQDAAQFLQYFLEQLDRAELKQKPQLTASASSTSSSIPIPTSLVLSFGTVTRSVCTADQKVKYVHSQQRETIWSIPIPMELAQLVTTNTTTTVEKNKHETPVVGFVVVDPNNNTTPNKDGPELKRHKKSTLIITTPTTTTPGTETAAAAAAAATTEDTESQGTADTEVTETPPEPVPRIDLMTCLDQWASETIVEDMIWPHLGENSKHAALQTTKLRNFPPYLVIQLQRYTLGPDWQPIKLQVELQLPVDPKTGQYILDLQNYKCGDAPQQPNEVLVPPDTDDDINNNDTAPRAANNAVSSSSVMVDEAALGQLMDMGFSMNACQRALNAVGGSDVEAAMGWVFEHNNDPDFNDPLPEPVAASNAGSSSTNNSGGGPGGTTEEDAVVQSLVEMLGCFTAEQVRFALKKTNGQTDRAADWLFSHMDELDALMASAAASAADQDNLVVPPPTAGGAVSWLDSSDCSTYQLMGMISHIGKHTGSGHYVAHLHVNGKWIIFNDEKVAESTQPPVEHAYLYLWQRTDTLSL